MIASDDKNRPGSNTASDSPAKRALEEAGRRKKKRDKAAGQRSTEIDGRNGPEPTRYGDWEKNGIISDF